jgi:hypothetical protein
MAAQMLPSSPPPLLLNACWRPPHPPPTLPPTHLFSRTRVPAPLPGRRVQLWRAVLGDADGGGAVAGAADPHADHLRRGGHAPGKRGWGAGMGCHSGWVWLWAGGEMAEDDKMGEGRRGCLGE